MQPKVPPGGIILPGNARRQEVPKPVAADLDAERPCGDGRFSPIVRGVRVDTYCAEPLCIKTGSCTGPRFVPEYQQLSPVTDKPVVQDAQMAVEAAKAAGELARRETGRPDERSDRTIARHIGHVWQRIRQQMQGGGEWQA